MQTRPELTKKLKKPSNSLTAIQNFISKNWRRKKKHACYVLITCDAPSKDGKMHVEMTYEGDTILAAYLIENAQSILDQRIS